MEESSGKYRLDSERSTGRESKKDRKDKKLKKHKKEKKHKKSKKVKRSKRDDVSGSSSSSSEDEWVEKPATRKSENPARDDWMLMSNFGASFKTKKELQPRRNPREDPCKRAMDQPGQTSRELNPYWKNGGSGLPPEDPKKFHRPGEHSDEDDTSKSSVSLFSTKRQGWKKPTPAGSLSSTPEPVAKEETRPRDAASSSTGLLDDDNKVWTEQELNALGAKIVKAEIMGNEERTDLANSLKKTLAEARQQMERQKEGGPSKGKEAVLLTYTDSRGVSRPLTAPSGKGSSSNGGGRKRDKVDTHEAGKRVRYFADDDKHSLSKMFEKEKLNTAEDENLMFSTLAGARAERNNDEYDIDDMFVSRAHKGNQRAAEDRDRAQAVSQHQQREKAVGNCPYCIDSDAMQKHLIIALAEKSYLCLPQHESLTAGHCLIVPRSHVTCATQLDEDVWEEMQLFRKALTRMFEADDEDSVFFETAMNLRYFPHMVIECVPLDRSAGDTAPIYFKKALLDCESEWSMNKKVIDLRGKDVRRGVPRGLPYFFVDFGLDSGFAHVIEDEKRFPRNFAQEILGGIMDLDPRLWRRPRKESFEEQRKKVLDFMAKWKPYDFASPSK